MNDEHYKAVLAELKAINKKISNKGDWAPALILGPAITIICILVILTWMY